MILQQNMMILPSKMMILPLKMMIYLTGEDRNHGDCERDSGRAENET